MLRLLIGGSQTDVSEGEALGVKGEKGPQTSEKQACIRLVYLVCDYDRREG